MAVQKQVSGQWGRGKNSKRPLIRERSFSAANQVLILRDFRSNSRVHCQKLSKIDLVHFLPISADLQLLFSAINAKKCQLAPL
jgi:hypothetical protein